MHAGLLHELEPLNLLPRRAPNQILSPGQWEHRMARPAGRRVRRPRIRWLRGASQCDWALQTLGLRGGHQKCDSTTDRMGLDTLADRRSPLAI